MPTNIQDFQPLLVAPTASEFDFGECKQTGSWNDLDSTRRDLLPAVRMPAMLDDPSAATVYRTSGPAPFPSPHDSRPPSLPLDVFPRQVTLRDRITTATIVPFSSPHQVPRTLLACLCDQLNKEIENGDTYPMTGLMSTDQFATYWFQNFAAVMLWGTIESTHELLEGSHWNAECLGSYYIKPNYPGRSSHICNAGFLVTNAARNKGVGRLLGESYLDWAPKLGYTYSVFNLVYETNVASCRIWDALGFKRIGKVKGAGNLKSYPGQYIDAIIYGRDLGPEGEDFVSEERFDKIKFYLKYGKYPAGADRAEKSRLRSAATHYKLVPATDKLMLKDKEVISDPQEQYVIARDVHAVHHGGINKTTATIAEKYHWVRIKETVSLVIRNCSSCKELGKAPVVRADGAIRPTPQPTQPQPHLQSSGPSQGPSGVGGAGRVLRLSHQEHTHDQGFEHAGHGSVSPQVLNRSLPGRDPAQMQGMQPPHLPPALIARMHQNDYMPLDPQIMEHDALVRYHPVPHSHSHYDDPGSFQAMLRVRDGGDGSEDLDMLIDQEEEGGVGGGAEGHEEGVHAHKGEDGLMQMQAATAARAAAEALRTVGRDY